MIGAAELKMMRDSMFNEHGYLRPGKPDAKYPDTCHHLAWHPDKRVPSFGDRVLVTFNGFGPGTVVGYATENGYLGVHVHLDNLPDWYVQQGGSQPGLFYAIEIKPLEG